MKKILTAALLLVTMVFAGCGGSSGGDDAKEAKKITIGLDDEYAPMGFKNEQNEIIGFELNSKPLTGTAKRRSLNRGALT